MPLTKTTVDMLEATGTPSASNFLRGDGSWNTPASGITAMTAVASTSGTSIDFTGIPAGVKRITVMFNGVSVSGTSILQVQLGDSGGIENTSYVSVSSSSSTSANSTTGLVANSIGNAAYVITGVMTIVNLSTNLWISSGTTNTDPASGNFANSFAGRKTLSDTLDRVRITTVNGTDTFDAGTINVLYER